MSCSDLLIAITKLSRDSVPRREITIRVSGLYKNRFEIGMRCQQEQRQQHILDWQSAQLMLPNILEFTSGPLLNIGGSLLSIVIFVFTAKRRQPNPQQDKKPTTKASSKGNLVTDLDIFFDCLDPTDCVLHVFGDLE
jgi:hypothetical protein